MSRILTQSPAAHRKFTHYMCILFGGYGFAQERQPDLVLRGTVTYADRQTYLELPFSVGRHVTRISVELTYTERDKHTSIDLGVCDSERFRGWSGGNKKFFTISETDATPSYLPGVIVPGQWKLILGVPNIEEGVRSNYEVKIYFSHRADLPKDSTFNQSPLRDNPAWYRGDLHMHNAHSDGSCLSQRARKYLVRSTRLSRPHQHESWTSLRSPITIRPLNTMTCGSSSHISIISCSCLSVRLQTFGGMPTFLAPRPVSI